MQNITPKKTDKLILFNHKKKGLLHSGNGKVSGLVFANSAADARKVITIFGHDYKPMPSTWGDMIRYGRALNSDHFFGYNAARKTFMILQNVSGTPPQPGVGQPTTAQKDAAHLPVDQAADSCDPTANDQNSLSPGEKPGSKDEPGNLIN